MGRLSSSDLAQLLTRPSCDVCRRSIATTNLWLCLYPDCYMMGCAETRDDHSSQHYRQNPSHAIQLNVSNKRAWCELCKAEVFLSNNVPRVQGVLGTRLRDDDEEEILPEQSEAGLVGLANLGNTCYMNSTLQCLSNTPALTKLFLNCPELLATDIKPNLGQAYWKLLLDLWQSAGEHDFVAPTGVLHAIKQAWPAFRGFQQHDAQEFLSFYFESIQREAAEFIGRRDVEIRHCFLFQTSLSSHFHQYLLYNHRDHDVEAPVATREESDSSDAWVTLEEEQLGLAKVKIPSFSISMEAIVDVKHCTGLVRHYGIR